jgi:hypothetical protein
VYRILINFLYIFFAPLYITVLIKAFIRQDDEISILKAILYLFGYSFVTFATTSISFLLYLIFFWVILLFGLWRVVIDPMKYLSLLSALLPYLIVAYTYLCLVFFMYGQPEFELGHTIAMSLWPSIDNNIHLLIARNFNLYGTDMWSHPIWDKIPLTDRINTVLGLILGPYYIHSSENFIYCIGVACQCLWVVPCLQILGNQRNKILKFCFLATIPVVFFFSIYLWWKIMAATFVLIALVLYQRNKSGYFFGLLIGVLTHASHIFSVPVFLLRSFKISRIESFFVGGGIGIFILINIIWPSSGQLFKWHFLGEPNSTLSIKQLFIDKIIILNFFELKIKNIFNSIYPIHVIDSVMSSRPYHSELVLRYIQQYSLIASLVIFIPILGLSKWHLPRFYYIFVMITFFITNFMEYGGEMSEAILHHRSFVEYMVLSLIIAAHIRNAFFLVIACLINIANFIFIWLPLCNVDGLILQPNFEYLFFLLLLIIVLIVMKKKFVLRPYLL